MKTFPTFEIENEVIAQLVGANHPTQDFLANKFARKSIPPHQGAGKTPLIAGVDEAGRGPLCGPVVAAAVIVPGGQFSPLLGGSGAVGAEGELCDEGYVASSPHRPPGGAPLKEGGNKLPVINDSKQMTRHQRATAFDWIMENCLVGVGQCSPEEIDELNILHASMLAMKRAIAALSHEALENWGLPNVPDFVLVDGNRLPNGIVNVGAHNCAPSVANATDNIIAPDGATGRNYAPLHGKAIVKGDSKSLSIAAASIIAKETRDKIMRELAAAHPQYGWEKNAGYPTAAHLKAIKEFGINQHYRKTFSPVAKMLV